MYVTKPWTIRQYAGFSTAEESNAFYRATRRRPEGLSVAFDLATHRGYDSTTARGGDVGKAGVAIDSILDMKILFDGIPLDKVSVSMTMNGAVLPDPGVLHRRRARGAGREARTSPARSRTTSSRSSWCGTPTSIRPRPRCGSSRTSSSTPRRTCRSSTRSRSPATTCRKPAPPPTSKWPTRWPTGSNTCAPASAGIDIDAFAPRLSFFWAQGKNFFMEVAKMRAARVLWAKIVAVQPEEPEVDGAAHALADLRLVAHRAGSVQQRRPHLHRGAGPPPRLGHTQSLHTNALDEAIALPTDFSARIARNTQLFLQEETGICNVVDPWGGSYYVEALTDELMKRPGRTSEEVERSAA
jgi:methylmalonyl-CoA mutase